VVANHPILFNGLFEVLVAESPLFLFPQLFLDLEAGGFAPKDESRNSPQDEHDTSGTNAPAYAWMTVSVPPEAVSMSFDFMLQGDGADDSFVVALNGTNVLSLEMTLIETNVTMNSGPITVSQWAGQEVELFLGIAGGTSTNAHVRVSGITFYSIMPPSLQAQVSGNNLVVMWPISGDGYALETSTRLTGTNSWMAVTNVPAIVDFQNTVTNAISAGSRFYRLKKAP
jgi:hypothetical protein